MTYPAHWNWNETVATRANRGTPSSHHRDGIAMHKAIGDLYYEIIDHSNAPPSIGSVQYMVLINENTKVSIIRLATIRNKDEHTYEVDYLDDSNYEIALMVDEAVDNDSVRSYLNPSEIQKILQEIKETLGK